MHELEHAKNIAQGVRDSSGASAPAAGAMYELEHANDLAQGFRESSETGAPATEAGFFEGLSKLSMGPLTRLKPGEEEAPRGTSMAALAPYATDFQKTQLMYRWLWAFAFAAILALGFGLTTMGEGSQQQADAASIAK